MKPSPLAIRFDPSCITDAVISDLREHVRDFGHMPLGQEQAIYAAALDSISKGGDAGALVTTMTNMGVPKPQAVDAARYWVRRAFTIISVERMATLGIKEAKWLYPGVPCYGTRTPSAAQVYMNELHQEANRKRYPIPEGMLIDGRRTHPGMERGCGCVHVPIIPGFDD